MNFERKRGKACRFRVRLRAQSRGNQVKIGKIGLKIVTLTMEERELRGLEREALRVLFLGFGRMRF